MDEARAGAVTLGGREVKRDPEQQVSRFIPGTQTKIVGLFFFLIFGSNNNTNTVRIMGNTSSDRMGADRHGGHKSHRTDSMGSSQSSKENERPKIMVDSTDDPNIFHTRDSKALTDKEFVSWQPDMDESVKLSKQARPTVIRWVGGGKEVFISGSFNNWHTKIPLIKSHNDFIAILDLPEGEHQYKFFVDGQWAHDPSEPVTTSQLGTINNVIQVKKSDFEVFDALKLDSLECSDTSDLSSSPPGPYHQEMYVLRPEERFKAPPILPPHLLQVILNKDTHISDGVMVLSATHRYKKKYVTTLLYKPI
ncbi:5'-AMP-activated protein kinase subunit beta-2-like isoform X2 [Carcharodon carcharias]|uniref:5'-AMP-activated protein kinase subunit beta-2-like isoform X2 n=1 Tax=Carcharodon carcharias TaxID=13397 RepID=UPI001B7E319F|nr:5'-AMP-activated protein kinase subunit beta-2-like isoform X2 [Carcharodon carcharias]